MRLSKLKRKQNQMSLPKIVGVGGAASLAVYLLGRWNDVDLFRPKSRTAKQADDLQLKSVQVVFRHGARTPIHPWMIPDPGEGSSSLVEVSWAELLPQEEDFTNRIRVTLYRPNGEKIGPLRWGKSTWIKSVSFS